MNSLPIPFERRTRRPAPETLVPCNIEAEEAVLGSLLLDPASIALVMRDLEPGHFYRETHQWVYAAARALAERHTPIDIITLRDELEQRAPLDSLDASTLLGHLARCTPTAAYIEHYAQIVRRDGERRAHIQAAESIAQLAYEERDPASLRADALKALIDAQGTQGRRGGLVPVGATFDALLERLTTGADNSIKTGLLDLDRVLGGFAPQTLTVIAARTSVGKTAFLLELAARIAAQGRAVAYFSLEMSQAALDMRLLSRQTQLSVRSYLGRPAPDDALAAFTAGMGEVTNLRRLLVDDTPGLSAVDVAARCYQQALRGPLDFVVVDYLQKLSALRGVRREAKRHEIVGDFVNALVDLGRELNIPVLTASQLNRESEKRRDAKPTLADLSEADAIAHHSDAVALLWRKSYYEPTCLEPNLLECNVAKNRHGDTGTINLWYDKATNRIENYTGAMP